MSKKKYAGVVLTKGPKVWAACILTGKERGMWRVPMQPVVDPDKIKGSALKILKEETGIEFVRPLSHLLSLITIKSGRAEYHFFHSAVKYITPSNNLPEVQTQWVLVHWRQLRDLPVVGGLNQVLTSFAHVPEWENKTRQR